jgi:cation diffusion facilitator CzcD-associated flavoprotein CzcO
MSSSTYQPPGLVSGLEGLTDAQVVVIGAGQAGLAVSHELTELGVGHVVLERARVGQTWRALWDSFCLVTPNWTMSLPGFPYAGDDPEGFVPRDEIVGYLERYASSSGRPFARASASTVWSLARRADSCCAPPPATWQRIGCRVHWSLPAPVPS